MTSIKRWFRLYCPYCNIKGDHQYLPEIQGINGLVLKCDRCKVTQEYTSYQLEHSEPREGN